MAYLRPSLAIRLTAVYKLRSAASSRFGDDMNRNLLLLVFCTLIGVRQGHAQALYGSILGSVADASGSAVPGATVKVIQKETNQTRSATTTEAGAFNFTTLPAGTYEVTIVHD